MSPEARRSASVNLRAILVVAALVCLCVSSNVGLQFFPLPAVTSQVVLHAQQNQESQASHAPRADAQGSRVPMMVQSNKRTDKDSPQFHPVTAVSTDAFNLPRAVRLAIEVDYPVCFLTPVPMTPHAGRAPPSSV